MVVYRHRRNDTGDNLYKIPKYERAMKYNTKIILKYSLDGELLGKYSGSRKAAKSVGCDKGFILNALKRDGGVGVGFIWKTYTGEEGVALS